MKKLLLIVLILLIANITYSYALIDNPVISPDGMTEPLFIVKTGNILLFPPIEMV
jgi:hypothetical protein